eukprot:gene5654-11405_t
MTTLVALKAAGDAASAEQKREIEKRRYIESAERLQHEAGSIISKFEVADNIDLPLILNDFETYYEFRLGKKPKIVRKLNDEDIKAKAPKPRSGSRSGSTATSNKEIKTSKSGDASNKLPSVNGATANGNNSVPEDNDDGSIMGIQGTSVQNRPEKKIDNDDVNKVENRLLKPPPQFLMDGEMKQLAGVISREIYQDSPNVRFEDIIRLDAAKRLLKEAVQLPLRYPLIFTGILRPWKGILLHGPPGTGKTMLAKAVATECRTTFFNISASSLVSKWRGDSEKLVRALFELARYHAPSTIFLDEIDSILGARGGGDGGGGEHEASRRMKTELLVQMDGLRSTGTGEQVFVMAASNLPWDLDIAVLRRLEKRVLVPLPEVEAREAMLRKHIAERAVDDLPFEHLAVRTEGYSGADIELLCREAAMRPVRRLMDKLQELDRVAAAAPPPPKGRNIVSVSAAAARTGMMAVPPEAPDAEALLKSDPVSSDDMLQALLTTKPSSDGKMDKYSAWQEEYGSV